MIIDSSALLAVIFAEPTADWVAEQFKAYEGDLQMSNVNLTETLIRVRSSVPNRYEMVHEQLMDGAIDFIAPDIQQVEIAAKARVHYTINLGDCFAYALARQLDKPILTLDSDFKQVDADIVMPPNKRQAAP